ncbi:MAG: glycerate kinase [Treponema sp.]|jgi:glycerate kinase|nr:glycerate kinase [Treponema sp.]
MNIIVAPDSFKGNMGAPDACDCIEAGIRGAEKDAAVKKIPLADGGEGTARAVTVAAGGRFVKKTVTGPLGGGVEAEFGLIDGGRTAVLDMASASGIELLPRERLDPMKATSFGTGELIAAALDTGARELIIGIGGSATSDGGIGILSALGFRLLDEGGRPVGQGGEALMKIAAIDTEGADRRLKEVSIKVACDVTNPLTGPLGAAAVFGPQKGAAAEMIPVLDAGLARLEKAWIRAGLTRDAARPGDGAAGGAGAALRICLGAGMESGALLVMKYAGFFACLPGTDLVITGEGMTDGQTMGGKLCAVVAGESRRAGVPAALISGALGGTAEASSALFGHFDYAVSISRGQTGLEAMIRDSREDLRFAAENLVRAIKIGGKMRT